MNNYERWLVKQRIYCEHKQCWARATHVVRVYGHDEVRCDNHGYRQKPKQATEQKQEQKQ